MPLFADRVQQQPYLAEQNDEHLRILRLPLLRKAKRSFGFGERAFLAIFFGLRVVTCPLGYKLGLVKVVECHVFQAVR